MLIAGICKSLGRRSVLVVSRNFDNLTCKMSSVYKWSVSLICPDDNHPGIPLKHKEAVFIGRSPETRIVDPRCSRKQVQLIADLNKGEVQAIQLGLNSSALDGVEMIKDKVYNIKPNSTLHVLTGLYAKKVEMKKLQGKDETKARHKSASETEVRKSSEHSKTRDRSSSAGSTGTSKTSKSEKNTHEKSASKKRSASCDIPEGSSAKKQKVDEKKPARKDDVKESSSAKKQKLNGKNSSGKDNDDDHMKDVAAKLDRLKSNAKKINTPVKSSTNFKVPVSPATPSTSKNGAISKSPATSSSKKGPVSTSPAIESRWDQYDTLYVYTTKGLENRRKIAGFDIDGTIITTQSGKVFPTHPGDWRLLYVKEIPKKIKKLHENGYKVVFFTNQMGVSKGKSNIADLKTKFVDVIDEIEIPVQILISTKGGLYRKPCPGMWNFFTQNLNGGVEVELSQSFYVGDAAGRQKDWAPKKKKDFSCSDRLFALNIGIEFKTPEEYFVGYPTCTKFTLPPFDPRKLSSKAPVFEPQDAALTKPGQEMILLVGYQASGKSFFAKKYLEKKGYISINRDTLGTSQKCLTACKNNIKDGNSVVIDNTNPDKESRARYLNVATANGIPCRCFLFMTTYEHAKHNERFREMTDKSHQAINDMIINTYRKNFVLPDKSEGFTEIVKVNFVPKFTDPELETLYRSFLLEK